MLQKGFTFIELILYIAILTVIAISSTELAINLVSTRSKSRVQENVAYNSRFATKRIIYELRRATGITSISPSDLCLVNPDTVYNPTRIYLVGSVIYLGWGGGGACTSTTNNVALTSNGVNISNLVFNNGSTGSSFQVDFAFNINGSGNILRKEWSYASVASGSGQLR
ncbi:MAG: prepilin-type N-terminal cleavage/methylation domain-containing protein [bacterium]